MKVKVATILYHAQTGFWFLPASITVGAIVLSEVMLRFDSAVQGDVPSIYGGFFRLGPEGARLFLSTIAGSMITVTSLVFSLTLVALTMASSQLGPRLLPSFMRDRVTQSVLGIFLGTFVYSLLVMRSLSNDARDSHDLSLTVSLVLAVSSFGLLIYFIHHVANGIRADTVIARVAADLRGSIDALFRQIEEEGADDPSIDGSGATEEFDADRGKPIVCTGGGYIEAIAYEDLTALAAERDLTIRLLYRAGQFVIAGQDLARVSPGDRVDDAAADRVRRTVALGPTRTMEQDVQYALAALVEVALRALSPGINDPHTAIVCIDHITAELAYATQRGLPPSILTGPDGRARVIAEAVTYEELIATAFDEIRQCGCANVAVTMRLAEALGRLKSFARSDSQRQVLRRQAEMIERAYKDHIAEPNDRVEIEKRLEDLKAS